MSSRITVAVATVLSLAFVGALQLLDSDGLAESLVSNGGQLLAAVVAAAGCAVAARRTVGQRRRSWLCLSAGTGAWAAGQLMWSWYEIGLGREVPFPSWADVGFLLFPLLCAGGLVAWLGTQQDQLVARGRDLLDGAIMAVSLLVLSWVTTLRSIVHSGVGSWLPLALSLAYPVTDLLLATLVLIALARGPREERGTLVTLVAGLGGLAFSDSAYVYLVGTGRYTSADLVTGGWVVGFLLVGAAGLSIPARCGAGSEPVPSRLAARGPSLLRLTLPYLPLAAAGATLVVHLVESPRTPTVELLLGLTLVTLVMSRQFLAMADNQRLLTALADARDQLEHQALHDSLTGLANRVLFADRLDRALVRPGADVSVLFCDLDDFKNVNDRFGHDTGDELLRVVADRLRGCVRLQDTVARIGGDEFAILLEDTADARDVADRIVESMREPVILAGRRLVTSISVGLARHTTPERRPDADTRLTGTGFAAATASSMAAAANREATAALLLRHADTAMYAAKGAGKGRAVLCDVETGQPAVESLLTPGTGRASGT